MRLNKSSILFTLSAVLLFLTLSACGTTVATPEPDENQEAVLAAAERTTYPLTVKDYTGREVIIKQAPQRLVSLSPSTTEILFALQAGDRVVGVTDYDNYPPEVLNLPKIGNFKDPNIEAVVAQKPDLVFASNLTGNEQIEALERAGFTTVMLQAGNINQIMDSILIIGKLTDTQEQAHQTVRDMKTRIAEIGRITGGLPQVKTFCLVASNDNWTTGGGTFIDELITLSGGINVAGHLQGWVKYSVEKLVEDNPAVIITFPHGNDIADVSAKPGFRDTDAVKNGRVIAISDENIVSRPSHRIILGLEEIAQYLHPEAFK